MNKLGIILLSLLFLGVTFSHSGRTDSNGGHNCRTGSCAGTYHYHNGGSSSTTKKVYSPPKSIFCGTYQCKLGNKCYDKPANSYCATGGSDAWVCNSGYIEQGGNCVEKVKEVVCGSNQCKVDNTCYDKPSNSYCSNSGGNIWKCNDGYNEEDNTCVKTVIEVQCSSYECEYNGSCIDRPANAICLIGGAVAWDCNKGYVKSEESCIKIIQEQGLVEQLPPIDTTKTKSQQPIIQNSTSQTESSGGTAAIITLLGYLGYKNRKRIKL